MAVFDRAYFDSVFRKDVMTTELMLQKSQIASQPLFRKLSDLTLWILVSEVFEKRTFKKGDKIMSLSRLAPTNKEQRKFYNVANDAFAKKMKQRVSNGGEKADTPEDDEMVMDGKKLKHKLSMQESEEL